MFEATAHTAGRDWGLHRRLACPGAPENRLYRSVGAFARGAAHPVRRPGRAFAVRHRSPGTAWYRPGAGAARTSPRLRFDRFVVRIESALVPGARAGIPAPISVLPRVPGARQTPPGCSFFPGARGRPPGRYAEDRGGAGGTWVDRNASL